MSSLLVLGAGGHGKVVADAAIAMRQWTCIAFADDRSVGKRGPLDLDVAGTLADCERLRDRFECVALGIGNNSLRLSIFSRYVELGFELPPIIHPSAVVSTYASVGAGSVVLAQAAISPGACVGTACIINTGATVDHDCFVDSAVHVSPGVHLAGNVKVGALAWIGIGACVKQGLTIGEEALIGAGSVVLSDVRPKTTVFGVPARVPA